MRKNLAYFTAGAITAMLSSVAACFVIGKKNPQYLYDSANLYTGNL